MSSISGSVLLRLHEQNQWSSATQKPEISGCWGKVKAAVLNFFAKVVNLSPENKFGLVVVVVLFVSCMAIYVRDIVMAFRR